MALLEVSRLSRQFGGVRAVNSLTFSIQPGLIFGVIGPNGAGKTTLFNMLSGFLPANQGSVRFRGTEILGKKPYKLVELGIARTFQLVKPFYGMTALETLQIPSWAPRARKITPGLDARRSRALELLERVGLGRKTSVVVDDLNQGELRLLDIARAVSTGPELLFLDEPFAGLGQEHISRLARMIQALKRTGVTIVIIEHRLRELMQLTDHVIVLNFGEKLAEGTPRDVMYMPEVVEAYLGRKEIHLG